MSGLPTFTIVLSVAAPLLLVMLWPVGPLRSLVVGLSPWAALPALVVAVLVPVGTTLDVPWLMLGTRLGVDAPGQTFLFFTAVLWGVGGSFGLRYLASDPARDRFFGFYLLAMTGNIGLVLSLDVPGFYVFFALMSFAAYGLVIHGRDPQALRAGRIYMYLVVMGEILLFTAFVLIAASTGSTNLPVEAGATVGPVALGLAICGFGIKAGVLPLHVWLPLAHPVAPTPASAVLSGAMIKAGVIGWLRFLPLGQAPQAEWGTLLACLGLAAAFFGVLVGVTQRNPKTVLAYSSISQMGFITLGLGAGMLGPHQWSTVQAAVLLYALHHGLTKGALFLGVGVAGAAGGRGRGWVGFGLVLPALALAGAPLTSGAIAKTDLKAVAAALPGPWPVVLSVLLPLAAVGTTLVMARFLVLVWPRKSDQSHLSVGLWVPWGLLVAAAATTLFVWPGSAISRWDMLHPGNAWLAAWPVLAGALISLVAWRWGPHLGDRMAIPAGDLLALVERAGAWWKARQPARGLTGALATANASAQQRWTWFVDRLDTASLPSRIEHALQRWPVTGTVFLLIAAAFVLLLAAA
jgi:hydrogenase-4 component B